MAQRYKFRLQKLLELREEKEEESKRLFSKSQNDKIKVETELNNLKENYENYKGIRPGEDVIYQKIKRNYLFALEGGIKVKEKELILKEQELEFRRKDLKEKQVDRKTVETLKEKEYSSFIKEQDRLEQIDIDEFALYAYMRALKGGE
ncbi:MULTISPECIES: flagellar export protein FliJ [Clostridium]|uniref:Flagellar FliJ protein n=1 Tax=Clostridium cibarium TaxID=2762247 RepID=A0ABR8PNU2_9CLOT|nr:MULTISPECIES: flagellar export protein FliJ [Clostridium]MBD7909841.1 flagellar export protein FliJ [Clostridium cibarium]